MIDRESVFIIGMLVAITIVLHIADADNADILICNFLFLIYMKID